MIDSVTKKSDVKQKMYRKWELLILNKQYNVCDLDPVSPGTNISPTSNICTQALDWAYIMYILNCYIFVLLKCVSSILFGTIYFERESEKMQFLRKEVREIDHHQEFLTASLSSPIAKV